MKRAKSSAKRPFRIWEAKHRRHARGRNYVHLRHAMDSALVLVKWAVPGESFEVYDVRNGRLHAQYRRGPASISIFKG
jgi:hypothetical protein